MPGPGRASPVLPPCCMYRKTASHCIRTVHTDAVSPFQATFSNCMYRKTALQCVPTVHTDWVWCVECGADGGGRPLRGVPSHRHLPSLRGQDGCFVLAKTEIAVFGLRQHHQHVAGKDFAVFLPEHVLQHLPGQENAIILTGHVLGPLARRQRHHHPLL